MPQSESKAKNGNKTWQVQQVQSGPGNQRECESTRTPAAQWHPVGRASPAEPLDPIPTISYDLLPMDSNRTTWQKLLLIVGGIGPVGHAPASGTLAVAVAGIPSCWLMQKYLSLPAYVAVVAVMTLVSVAIHQIGDRILGEKDSRKLVWDELVGYWIAMFAVPWTWQLVVIGFFLERAIDIAKVFPANVVEKRVPGGWGVVGDDVVAGLYTCGVLHLACYLAPGVLGLLS